MTTTALILGALLLLPSPSNLRAAAHVPWVVDAAVVHHVDPVLLLSVPAGERSRWMPATSPGGRYCGAWQTGHLDSGFTCQELQGQPGVMRAARVLKAFHGNLSRYAGCNKKPCPSYITRVHALERRLNDHVHHPL